MKDLINCIYLTPKHCNYAFLSLVNQCLFEVPNNDSLSTIRPAVHYFTYSAFRAFKVFNVQGCPSFSLTGIRRFWPVWVTSQNPTSPCADQAAGLIFGFCDVLALINFLGKKLSSRYLNTYDMHSTVQFSEEVSRHLILSPWPRELCHRFPFIYRHVELMSFSFFC